MAAVTDEISVDTISERLTPLLRAATPGRGHSWRLGYANADRSVALLQLAIEQLKLLKESNSLPSQSVSCAEIDRRISRLQREIEPLRILRGCRFRVRGRAKACC